MELTQYLQILARRWWILAVAVIATAISAVVFAKLQTPVYQSTAEVVIQPARPDFGLTQSAKTLLRSYMTVADSNKWAQQVIDRLQLDMTPQQLRANARFAAEDDRMVIRIEIEDTDGEVANRIARTWALLMVEWRDQENQRQRKEDRVFAELRDEPTYSQSWPPRTLIMLAAGAILGLLIGFVVLFAVEWVESAVVRTPADVEQWLGLTLMATVPLAELPRSARATSHPEKAQ
ncbi:MAG: Wzz/FepE/Etk N-terminal domain-containing protein [Anaerolineae bacterium]|nr:Wzz/FepE/Etk N-terminal domain-containing protein [Anaerolineae bacterium]MCX8067512.1 Wzz/FepE/Etk N-terminal domain-containing protein [Anaerolineae bacterium]MDW7991967.1 Wzz/FepE/Etk N-terminal domain-containing protein [Anaerolineae bacterium]